MWLPKLAPHQKQRTKELLKKLGIILLIGLVYYVIVSLLGFGIPCPIRTITGFQCPGCGITRMCVSLFKLDFRSAFNFHPVVFCSLPFLAVCFCFQAFKYIKTGDNGFNTWQHIIIWPCIIALLIFGVVRNIV